jgi:protein-tyrosine phosphatase
MKQGIGGPFELLFVCHANLCRSPMAERFAQRALDDAFGATAARVCVSSAGTHAFVGAPMHQGSAQVLRECGVDATGFASRSLSAPILAGAGLVLAAGREQRAACVTMAPATVRRTFTIRQFVRFVEAVTPNAQLTQGSPSDRLHALVEEVNSVRSRVQPVAGNEDDLPDPVRQPIEAFRVCADELKRAMSVVLGVIAPA